MTLRNYKEESNIAEISGQVEADSYQENFL